MFQSIWAGPNSMLGGSAAQGPHVNLQNVSKTWNKMYLEMHLLYFQTCLIRRLSGSSSQADVDICGVLIDAKHRLHSGVKQI